MRVSPNQVEHYRSTDLDPVYLSIEPFNGVFSGVHTIDESTALYDIIGAPVLFFGLPYRPDGGIILKCYDFELNGQRVGRRLAAQGVPVLNRYRLNGLNLVNALQRKYF